MFASIILCACLVVCSDLLSTAAAGLGFQGRPNQSVGNTYSSSMVHSHGCLTGDPATVVEEDENVRSKDGSLCHGKGGHDRRRKCHNRDFVNADLERVSGDDLMFSHLFKLAIW